ncbi:MAG: single-stranded-DNA-specific exonuclease RecJ [Sphaerochaetaceae bacterium]|nr:single-stranded-DNA-specific exonuclease RecJ [Sphaerochaetaceae bacterium]MDD4397206.1 single-stranded-DNA-specific exonuclease RecJ [Sphaerochaetaceae bacterium]
MKWTMENQDSAQAAEISRQFNTDPVLSMILAGRGITEPSQLKFYLTPDIAMLHNPFLFDDMVNFCDRIMQAEQQKEKVFIFGDRDVDGITSTVLMKTELEKLGLECRYSLPENDAPYGMTAEGVEEAAKWGATLIITVDCGISCFEEISHASKLGMDTIICDHHLSGDTLPPAFCIIDPKIPGCGYPFADLAACGVTAKCIWALRFAHTDLYNETMILLHCTKNDKLIVIEAARLENLVTVDRVIEEIIPGVVKPSDSKVLSFIGSSTPIVVLDADYEKSLLDEAFLKKIDINLIDIRPQLESVMPVVATSTLFGLSQRSKAARYMKVKSELDTLISMFCAYVRLKHPELGKDYSEVLDLVAIGTISDLMPLSDENRVLVRTGLQVLESGKRKSMQPFMLKLGLAGKHLSSTDIGWQIAPCINAAGRLGSPSVACDMLLAKDQDTAELLAWKLVELNKQRQHLSETTWSKILPKARESYETFGSKMIVLRDDDVVRGIAGVMANRLMKQFNAPAMIITSISDDTCSGSMRSFGDMNTREFLMKYSDLFTDFGGHKYAGGFSIPKNKVDELVCRIADDADYMDCPAEEDETIPVDAVLPPEYFTPDLIKTVELFEPYGEKNPPLMFLIRKARIEQAEILRAQKGPKAHLKLTISHGSYQWPAVYWFAADKLNTEFSEGDIVDVAFKLGRNSFRNQDSLQLTIAGISRVGA